MTMPWISSVSPSSPPGFPSTWQKKDDGQKQAWARRSRHAHTQRREERQRSTTQPKNGTRRKGENCVLSRTGKTPAAAVGLQSRHRQRLSYYKTRPATLGVTRGVGGVLRDPPGTETRPRAKRVDAGGRQRLPEKGRHAWLCRPVPVQHMHSSGGPSKHSSAGMVHAVARTIPGTRSCSDQKNTCSLSKPAQSRRTTPSTRTIQTAPFRGAFCMHPHYGTGLPHYSNRSIPRPLLHSPALPYGAPELFNPNS